MKRLFIIAFIGILALAGAAFWVWQSNQFSKDVVRLEILAPEEIRGGEEFEYVVRWKHNGNVRLDNPQLVFEYPEGAIPGGGYKKRETRELDAIYPGQETTVRFPARLFGEEGAVKEARAALSYQPKELTASYRSETTVSTRISSTSLSFEMDLPSQLEGGQQFSFNLNYFSQSSYPLSDLRIQIAYPEGFEFLDAIPSSLGENEWRVAVLNQGDGGRITVQGALEGDPGEVKLFTAKIGTWREGEFTLLREVTKGVEVATPNLMIFQRINGQEEYIATPGEVLHYEIFFRNMGERNLENLFLVTELTGRPFDFESVSVPRGTFRENKTITWEAQDVSTLRFLGKGEEGKVEFWITAKEDWEVFSPQDKDFFLENRVLLSEAERNFRAKVAGTFSLEQEGFFASDAFSNTGPLPPRVGQPTTYTVRWTVRNSFTDAQDVRVTAQLPSGVEMTGSVRPSEAPLTFDSSSREVVWTIGDMASAGSRTASFQIRFTPHSGQIGTSPVLVEEGRVTGMDVFAGQQRSASGDAFDTTLPDDETVSEQEGRVVSE